MGFRLSNDGWQKELEDHKRRLHTVKCVVPNASIAKERVAAIAGRSGKNTPRKQVATAGEVRNGDTLAQIAPSAHHMRIDQLSTADQDTCEAMVRLLMKLPSQEKKAIVEELFVAAEMRQLLENYTGVYPDVPEQPDKPNDP